VAGSSGRTQDTTPTLPTVLSGLDSGLVVAAATGLASCHLFAFTRRKVLPAMRDWEPTAEHSALRGLPPRLSPASPRLHLSPSPRDPVSADASLPAASTSGW
jgi:hypothetical protein